MKMTGVKLYDRKGDDSDFGEFDLETEVFFIELSKKTLFKKLPHSIPDKTPIFYTTKGIFITIMSLHLFGAMLKNLGFDFLNPSNLVNMALVNSIVVGVHGNFEAVMGNGERVSVSEPMKEKYNHLIKGLV